MIRAVMTVVGGLHATLRPLDFTDPAVDVIVPGQAVNTFRAIVRNDRGGLTVEVCPGHISAGRCRP